jgi:hypothetical protein
MRPSAADRQWRPGFHFALEVFFDPSTIEHNGRAKVSAIRILPLRHEPLNGSIKPDQDHRMSIAGHQFD